MSRETGGNEASKSGGLFNSLQKSASTLLAIVQTRLELLTTEFEEERIRLTSIFLWMQVMLFCAGMGVIFSTLLLVVALWDDHRLLAVGIPAIVFSVGALIIWRIVLDKTRRKPRIFSASLQELAKDQDQLASDHE